jgi:hypothetical protein
MSRILTVPSAGQQFLGLVLGQPVVPDQQISKSGGIARTLLARQFVPQTLDLVGRHQSRRDDLPSQFIA